MAKLVISYLHTLVYNPHKALANCFGEFGGHGIKQNLFSPKGRLFWNVKCQLDFFHFLREKRKKKKICQCFTQGNALRAGCYTTLMIGSDLPMDGLYKGMHCWECILPLVCHQASP